MDIQATQKSGVRNAIVRIAALVVTLTMLVATAVFGVGRAQAAELTATADPTTFTQWTEGVGNPLDPRSNGRVWTDKSVTTGDVTLDAGNGEQVVVGKDKAADFLVGLSAMSSAQQITGMSSGNKPLDVTLVLDVSGSMSSSMGLGYRPAYGDDLDYTAYVKTDDGGYKAVAFDYGQSVDGNVVYRDGDQLIYAKTSAEDANPDHVQLYNSYRITRLDALKTAVNGFLDQMATRNAQIADAAAKNRAGIVTFESNAQLKSRFTDDTAALEGIVNGLTDLGGTNSAKGFKLAHQLIDEDKRANADSVIIFFTDGDPWDGDEAIQEAKSLKDSGTLIYAVGTFKTDDVNNLTPYSNRYMQAVSSNYPNATGALLGDPGDRAPDSNYYMNADDADQLKNIFNDIWTAISSKPSSPIATTTESGMERGTITFTDELGAYMTVRDMNSVVFAGRQFTAKTSETSEDGATTTYVFEGEVDGNPIYGTANLADLVVTVTHGETETVRVQVPEQLLPLRLYSASVDQDGNVTTTINDTFPIRVFYSVGLKDGVRDALADPDEALAAYVKANGETFTSNKYDEGAERGSTTATFTPAKSNDFYYFVNDTPLYNSENAADPAKSVEAGKTYHYLRTYYADNAKHEQWIAVNGADAAGKTQTGANGEVFVPAGTVRMGLANYTVAKKDNVTRTATAAIAPRWDGTTVDVALGNNGRLAVAQEPVTPEPKPQEPTTPAETPKPTQPEGTVESAPTTNGSTANTGSSVALIVAVGAALLCAGLGTLQLRRRRSTGRHAG
ncbi:type IV secretion protein Rhs [Bifidobacterium italicum]|uniref:Type IV secretion protein Rhs n=1 Tax=Bifidobacterium italicum TaxID=1960968 RepID=A0A2A2EJ41_9BIFI|nr:VWA domain-containing protein [Bifidobacterium italicum]PAU69017.1 type IV secretion protein Rhs [Bifidobacterium italicum]